MASGPLTVKIQINADGSAAIVGLNKVKGALDATGKEAKEASGGIKALSSSLQGLALTAGAALSVGALAQGFITANIESQRLAKGLAAVAGSATAGAAEMDYISKTADKLGLSLTATGSAYVSLTAATKGTALEGQATRDIFESVSLAMGKLGKSSADTQGALTAMEQMISKGKVSAEELRGQLGERLPGAFKLAAEAIGVTTSELDDMLTKGEVLAADLLPALSQKLNTLYDDGMAIGGLEAEWNRLVNALVGMAVTADQASGATGALGSTMSWATGIANTFTAALQATANARAGLGFQTFADDSSKLVVAMQTRAKALDEYVQARKRADSYRGDQSYEAGMEADAAAALKRFQDMSVQANNLRTGLDAAAVAQDALNKKQAAGVGDDMVARWEEHTAAVEKHDLAVGKIIGSYDKQAAKAAQVAAARKELDAAVAAGTRSQAEADAILKKYSASLEESGKKAGGAGKAHAVAANAVKAYTSDLEALIAKYLPARDDAEKLSDATAVLDKAMAKGDITGTEYSDMLKALKQDHDTAANAAQDLIDKYDREGAAARTLAEDSDGLNKIIAEGGPAAERAKVALENLGKQQAKNSQESAAWTEVWENAVKRIDDTFANLWEDLFSGGKSALASLKKAITSWLAEVAHALLTKPLVVAITAGMTGGGGTASAAGMTGGGGAVGGVTSGLSGLSSFSSIGSMFSTAFSLGGYFLEGVYSGFASIMAGTSGAALSAGAAGVASGNSAAMAAGAGVLAVYALPVIIAGAAIFAKYQKDQKPRTGAFAATTHGGVGQLEDSIGVAGGFGLTFGVNDKGSANIDAEEMREAFEGFAQVSLALEQFYGHDIAAEVEATLKQISNEHYAKTGILNYAMDMNEAFDVAFTQIIDAAAATGDSVAVVMKAVVGDLSGTAESMAKQIDSAMRTTAAVVTVAKAMEGTDAGKILELGDDLTANALRLVDYARSLQWSGEELSATLGRMGLYLTGLDAALELTGTQTEATGQDFIDLARNLAYAADEAKVGMEGLIQLQNNYYQHFFSEEERALKVKEDSIQAISEWNTAQGVAGIDTSAELRAYIETLDLETEAGRRAHVEAMKITLAFIALDEALATLGGTVTDTGNAIADAAAIAEERAGLEMRLLELVGTESQILAEKRRLELAAVDESNRALLQRIYLLEDEAAAAARIAANMGEMSSLIERMYAAAGDTAMVTQMQRQEELAAATTAGARALLQTIFAIEDAVAANEAAQRQADEAARANAEAASAAEAAARTAFDASQEAAREQAAAVQELVSTLQSLRDALKSAIEAIFIETPLTRVSTRDEAQEQITAALVAARGGTLPDLDKLSPYLKVVSQNAESQFRTLEEYQRDAYRTRADLVELEALIGDRQTVEEQMLAALETIINESFPSAESNADQNAAPLATSANVQALIAKLDLNHDGIVDKWDALYHLIQTDNATLFAKIDTNGDKALTKDEFMAGVAGMASDETLISFWHALDLNHDGLLSATEAIPLQIATSLSSYFNTLDNNTDGLLTYAELQSGLSGLATNNQIQQLIWAVDANGDGMISEQEASTFKLGSLDTKADYQSQQLIALSYIATDIQKVDNNTANINYWQGEALGKFDTMILWLNNIAQYTHLDYQNTKLVAQHFTAQSYATGGIADGPLSGYGATLHGREAVIPLGDGNKVVATLREPANYLPGVPDSAGLRAALEELQAELRAMRRDQQTIGATTAGELKEHNRRERKRDVVPQQVEVIS